MSAYVGAKLPASLSGLSSARTRASSSDRITCFFTCVYMRSHVREHVMALVKASAETPRGECSHCSARAPQGQCSHSSRPVLPLLPSQSHSTPPTSRTPLLLPLILGRLGQALHQLLARMRPPITCVAPLYSSRPSSRHTVIGPPIPCVAPLYSSRPCSRR